MGNSITRRGFIGGSAVAAMGAVAALSLSGCAPTNSTPGESTPDGPGGSTTGGTGGYVLNPQDESYNTYTSDCAALFEPIQVGPLKLKNRLIKSAAGSDTATAVGTELMSLNAIEYYTRFARGGASMVLIETGTINRLGFDPTVAANRLAVQNRDDGIEHAKQLTDSIHQYDCYVGYQLSSPGGPVGPLPTNDLTTDEIKDYVKQMGEAGLRLKKAGFDALEIKGATSDGLNGFLSRRVNTRNDEYGCQNLKNRTRFFAEMIAEVKRVCGADFAVFALINGAEENDTALGVNDKYLTIEETCAIAKLLEEAGADLVQVRVGTNTEITMWAPDVNHAAYKSNGMTGYGNLFDYSKHFSGILDGSHSGTGCFIPACAEIKKGLKVPVGCAGAMDPRLAPDFINDAVKRGDIDLVFLNRCLTVDPELPNKLKAGKRDEIAPCCHCMHCHARPLGFPDEVCRVNATTQNAFIKALTTEAAALPPSTAKNTMGPMPEGYDLIPATTKKKVMVIGGGPAGMEAARVAAQRGHTVSLYEKESSLGGLLKTADAYKGSHEHLTDLIDYLVHQQELYGVDVHTGTEVTASLVDEQKPDAIVVAVGGSRESKLSSTGNVNVVGVIGLAGAKLGEKVVILGAGAQAVDMAFYLLAQGKSVQMVHEGTPDDVDKEQSPWFRLIVLPHLYAKGVKVWNESRVLSVGDGGVTIATQSDVNKTISCDTVVECYDMAKNLDLAKALESKYEVYTAGDCAYPWNIQQAILKGHLAARKI